MQSRRGFLRRLLGGLAGAALALNMELGSLVPVVEPIVDEGYQYHYVYLNACLEVANPRSFCRLTNLEVPKGYDDKQT